MEESRRVRFNKREIAKLVTALENVDAEQLDHSMRALDLEERLADSREQTERWRRAYEAVSHHVIEQYPHADFEALDRKIRGWVGEA